MYVYIYKIEILFTIAFQARKKEREVVSREEKRGSGKGEAEEGNEGGIRIRARRRKGEFDRVSVAGARIALNNPAS